MRMYFVLVKWSVEIYVTYVHGHILGAWSGNDAVDMHLECFKAGSFSADITRIVKDEVTAAGDPGLVCFFLLWSDGADDSGVGDGVARWCL